MNHHIITKLLLFLCLISCPVWQINAQPVPVPVSVSEISSPYYIYESIDVPSVDFLELTASNDFGGYAGNTRSSDGTKTIGFTLIDGVFKTYDFPGSVNTYFYGLANNGIAVGHYIGQDGLYHGLIMEDEVLTQYDFPGAVQTNIYGISDETGALSGNIFDAEGNIRGFSGDLPVMFPGAVTTYADFVNAEGVIVGSYVGTDGIAHGFMRNPDGSFITVDVPELPNLEFLFVNAINDVGVVIFRAKAVNDIPRSYILLPGGTPQELRLPGSVSTVVRNINQDGSIIGYYDSSDGRRHGFVANPVTKAESDLFGHAFNVTFSKGLNMFSVPLAPPTQMSAKSLVALTGATTIIRLDAKNQRFIGWTPSAPDDGFQIEGGQGYIVNVPQPRNFAFVGSRWIDGSEIAAAPTIAKVVSPSVWAFVVSGNLDGIQIANGFTVKVRNLRTDTVMTSLVRSNYFAAATADLSYRSVVEVGDKLEITVVDTNGNIVSEKYSFTVNATHLENAVMNVKLGNIGTPKQSQLLQNYPNPFNPETWLPFHLAEAGVVSLSIYDATGKTVREFSLGHQSAGFYQSRGNAVFWDGQNAFGEAVSSGVYFYQLTTPTFQQTKRMIILK